MRIGTKHLEVLCKLFDAKEPLRGLDFLGYRGVIPDLIEQGLVYENKDNKACELTAKGITYCNYLVKYANEEIHRLGL